MQRLGQHFLKNLSVVGKIVAALELSDGDTIIEVGPGHGELTVPLAEACAKIRGNMVAVERDEALAKELRIRLQRLGAAAEIRNIEVVNADALGFFGSSDPKLRGIDHILRNDKKIIYKVAGNIPYYITGHLLRIISELELKPKLCVFMLQKEVAERIRATPPKMNRLAASVQFWAEPKLVVSVPRKDFAPPPDVDSAVIALKLRGSLKNTLGADVGADAPIEPARYYAALHALFAQPRKTILNNLAANHEKAAGECLVRKESVAAALQKIGINPKLRPQNLSVADITVIARVLF